MRSFSSAGPCAIVCLGASLALCAAAAAGPSKSFRVTTYKDFAEGQEQGVLLSSQGDALTGLSTTRLALPSLSDDSVRAMAAADGGKVYLGTGGEGPSVLVYERGGLKKLVKLDASTWVSALCVLKGDRAAASRRRAPPNDGGELLAATAQDGRIFQISGDGRTRVLAKVEGDHVWALLQDPHKGVLYVATGPGKLWAVDLKGGGTPRVQKLFDSGARQLLGLAQGEDGALYTGASDDAVLYRVETGPGGMGPATVRALHDFSGNEVRAVAYHDGTVYVAVNDMQRDSGAMGKGVRITPLPAGTTPGNSTPRAGGPAGGEKQGKGALYRIERNGRVEQLHAISDGFFNALHVDGQGNLFAAASTPGGRGRVYWVLPDRTVFTALELKESDVLSLSFERPGERLLGTGNSGAVYRVSDQPQKDAHYLSKVLDGQSTSQWGTLRYAGAGPLHVETRSGNLQKTDSTWSPWQPLRKEERVAASGELAGKIGSPPGRYLQVKVGFGGKAVLHDLFVTYQPINQRPRLTDILVGEDPLGRLARGTKAAGQKSKQPLVKLRWKVENPDEDELSYRLYVRRLQGPEQKPELKDQKDAGWLRLGGPDPLLRTEFEWNTESVADGLYETRVLVSDERSNPSEAVLTHELVSPPFLVDNRRPEFFGVAFNPATREVAGKAADVTSPLAELAYSLDGADFLPIGVRDGVLDDPAEEFSFKLPPLPPGPHTLVLRAIDAADNVGALQLVVRGR